MSKKIYDHSSLQPPTDCERKHFHQNVERLRPKGGSPPLQAGSAGHRALEVIYREGFGAVEEAVEEIHQGYDLRPLGYWSFLTAPHLEIVIRNYVDRYRDREPYRVLSLIEEPLVSESILPFPFGGIPDLVVQDEQEGVSAIVDHKFTSGWFGNKREIVKRQQQGRLYVLLARDQLGFDGNRCVFNVISMSEKAADPNSSAQDFERMPFDYTEYELNQAKAWAIQAKERVEYLENRPLALEDEYLWIKNGGKHCKFCDYRDLCFAKTDTLRRAARVSKFEVQPESTGGILKSGADGDE